MACFLSVNKHMTTELKLLTNSWNLQYNTGLYSRGGLRKWLRIKGFPSGNQSANERIDSSLKMGGRSLQAYFVPERSFFIRKCEFISSFQFVGTLKISRLPCYENGRGLSDQSREPVTALPPPQHVSQATSSSLRTNVCRQCMHYLLSSSIFILIQEIVCAKQLRSLIGTS